MWESYFFMGLMIFMVLLVLLMAIRPSWFIISNDSLAQKSIKNAVGAISKGIINKTIKNWEHLRPYYEDFNRESGFPVSRFFDMLYMHLRDGQDLEWEKDLITIFDTLDCIKNEVLLQSEYDELEQSEATVFKAIGGALGQLDGGDKKGLLKTVYNKQVEYKKKIKFDMRISRLSLAISIIAFVFTIVGLFIPTKVKNIDEVATAVVKMIDDNK